MSSLVELKRLCEPVGGVKPSFDTYHVYLALRSLHREEPIGRVALARRLSIGGSSVKTLIRRMKERGLIDVDRVAGAFLTQKGREVAESLENTLKLLGPLDLSSICGDCGAYGLVIRGFRDTLSLRIGYLRLRDQIVREGAEGAIVVYCGRVPSMPVSGGLEEATGVLREVALRSCSEGDVLAVSICYGDRRSPNICERALVNAVFSVLDP
jgi:DNA-binding MarR family transcriptional regulator